MRAVAYGYRLQTTSRVRVWKRKARTGRAWGSVAELMNQARFRRAAPMPTKPKPSRAAVAGGANAALFSRAGGTKCKSPPKRADAGAWFDAQSFTICLGAEPSKNRDLDFRALPRDSINQYIVGLAGQPPSSIAPCNARRCLSSRVSVTALERLPGASRLRRLPSHRSVAQLRAGNGVPIERPRAAGASG